MDLATKMSAIIPAANRNISTLQVDALVAA